MTLPKYVNKQITRHGKTLYYFRRNKGRRLPLPGLPGTPEFEKAYKSILADHAPIHRHYLLTPARLKTEYIHQQKVFTTLLRSMNGARARAAAKGREFDLDADWITERVSLNNFCCELTGIEFYTGRFGLPVHRAFSPSLDRIDNSRGYTKDNVRIILLAANIMLSDWGHSVFKAVAINYATHTKGALPKRTAPRLRKTPNPSRLLPNPLQNT